MDFQGTWRHIMALRWLKRLEGRFKEKKLMDMWISAFFHIEY
jgi:hypothetical protein